MSTIPQVEKIREALQSARNDTVNCDNYLTRALRELHSLDKYVTGLEDTIRLYTNQTHEMRGK